MQKVLSGESCVYSSKNDIEKNFEFILPEYLPGISRIVKTSIQVEKCTFSSSVASSSDEISLRICVLYVSETGGKIKNATFHENISVPMRDPFTYEGVYTAIPSCYCTSLSSSFISSRKVGIKCVLCASVSVYAKVDEAFFDGKDKDGVCLLKKTARICSRHVLPEEFFEKEVQISIDEGKPSAGEIIYVNTCLSDVKTTVSSGMLEFEADAKLGVLYEVSEDESEDTDTGAYALCNASFTLRDTLACDKITEGCLPFIYVDIFSAEPTVSFDPYGSNKAITLNVRYAVSGFVYENDDYELVTDAFSENFKSNPEFSKFTINTIESEINARNTFSLPVRADTRNLVEISSCSLHVHSVSIEHAEGGFFANAKAFSEIIGANASGEIISLDIPVMLHVPFAKDIASDNCIPDIILGIYNCSASIKEGQLTLNFEACVNGVMTEHTQSNLIFSLNEDDKTPIPRNKGEIIICYPEKDASLWSIGKRYNVSPDRIKEANGIDDGNMKERRAIIIP